MERGRSAFKPRLTVGRCCRSAPETRDRGVREDFDPNVCVMSTDPPEAVAKIMAASLGSTSLGGTSMAIRPQFYFPRRTHRLTVSGMRCESLLKFWRFSSWTTLVVLVLLSPAQNAQASVIWTGDFETGTIKQWSYFFTEAQLKVVMTPVRAGKYALEATAKATNDRVEVQHGSSTAKEGDERYYGWSVMTPKALGPSDHQTGYFETKQSYMQIMAFSIKGTDVSLDLRPPNNRRIWSGKGKFTIGVWHDFTIHIKWSKDAAIGFIELWFDGQKVLTQTPAQTLWDGNGPFFQIGLLSGVAGEVVYVDEAREGTTLADVQLAPLLGGTGGAGGTIAMGGSGGSVVMGGTGGTTKGATGGQAGTTAMGGAGGQIQTTGSAGESGSSGQSGNAGSVGQSAGAAGGTEAPTDNKKSGGGCTFSGTGNARFPGVLLTILMVVGRARRRRP